jgi:Transposase DDE domain
MWTRTELWQVVCQWVWNVRLTLSHAMLGKELRDIEWSPSKALPPLFTPSHNLSETYGPWKWAKDVGRAPSRFRAGDFPVQENGTLRCPAGASLWVNERRQENLYTQRAVYAASLNDCQECLLREHCLTRGTSGNRARRVSVVRRLLPMTPIS